MLIGGNFGKMPFFSSKILWGLNYLFLRNISSDNNYSKMSKLHDDIHKNFLKPHSTMWEFFKKWLLCIEKYYPEKIVWVEVVSATVREIIVN